MTSAPLPVLSLLGHEWLAFELLHGEPLYVPALRALVGALGGEPLVVVRRPDVDRVTTEVTRAGLPARIVVAEEWWAAVRATPGTALLLHDALCPLASSEFLADVARRTREQISMVGYRPVTDTVKTAVDGAIQGTIDREGLAAITTPVLLAAAVLGDGEPPISDVVALVAWLRERGTVELVTAPSLARRVDDASAVNLLECVDELSRQVHAADQAPELPEELQRLPQHRTRQLLRVAERVGGRTVQHPSGLARHPLLEVTRIGRQQGAVGQLDVPPAAGAPGGLQQPSRIVQLVVGDHPAGLAEQLGMLLVHQGLPEGHRCGRCGRRRCSRPPERSNPDFASSRSARNRSSGNVIFTFPASPATQRTTRSV